MSACGCSLVNTNACTSCINGIPPINNTIKYHYQHNQIGSGSIAAITKTKKIITEEFNEKGNLIKRITEIT